ncbi:hypothetical protein ACFQMA_03025 [Halosimplex aquaticum]|uniref:CcmD family protein n=1 Tax=Halosimplex aquaticum TaxID=3026162 RepID=A0ABD5XUL9_9EURY|nr:hypothetical protein [Halosimplex aquaticum]
MVPLQAGGTPELLVILFFWTVLTVPLVIGAIAFANRVRGRDRADELEELRERVDELESERD